MASGRIFESRHKARRLATALTFDDAFNVFLREQISSAELIPVLFIRSSLHPFDDGRSMGRIDHWLECK